MAIKNEMTEADYLGFETEIANIDKQISELGELAKAKGINYSAEINALQKQQVSQLKNIYSNLSPWQTVQVARHPKRPLLNDYLDLMVTDFRPMYGDRCFGDDKTIVTGLGQIGRRKVMVIGQNKGRTTEEKIECNFGCPSPEGYRKALAKMKFAEKYNIPIVTFIDTPGAYPGIGAEERGQAQAIAVNLMEMSRLKVPVICIVIGEGGSGGALGIGVGDELAMLEFSYYSVISPEGCAAILWRDGAFAPEAAEALGLTSKDLLKLGLIDHLIKEPLGGAHRNLHDTVYSVEQFVVRTLRNLSRVNIDQLLEKRYQKLRRIGTDYTTSLQQRTVRSKKAIDSALKNISKTRPATKAIKN